MRGHWAVLLTGLLLLTGCSHSDPLDSRYPTADAAVLSYPSIPADSVVLFTESLGQDAVALLTSPKDSSLFVGLADKRMSGWKADSVVPASDMQSAGFTTYRRDNLGSVSDGEIERAKYHAIFGQVAEPRITWVEVSLEGDSLAPVRVNVINGFWLAVFDMTDRARDLKPATIRAGTGEKVLFTHEGAL